ncbi:MAG: hypothetical protein ACTSPY_16070 [Candidatus Helarchaeota archaeon]
MTRYVTDSLYTFELIFSLGILSICIIIALIKKDKVPFWIFLLTTLFHSILELVAQGVGDRVVETTYLFGIIPVGYPIIPIIIGLFEGGLVGISGVLLMRGVVYKDKFSIKVLLLIVGILLLFEIIGTVMIRNNLAIDPSALEITRRHLFTPGSAALLIATYSIGILGIIPWKKIPKKIKWGLLYYYFGLIIISAGMVIPLHITGVRYIEYFNGSTYVRADPFLDILIMYGYNAMIESAGYFMAYYVIFYYLKLLKNRKEIQNNKNK